MKHRTAFEYRLKRRISKEEDFLRYIEYELNLERIFKERIAEMELKNTSDLDQLILKRIHLIFNRALRKFKGDVKLWVQFFEFAKQFKSLNSVSKIYGNALQLHPTQVGLWILAADFEYEFNGNMVAARALMQKGLRFNPESQKLWTEYFKLELFYLKKILERNSVLGISSPEAENDAHFLNGAIPLEIFKNVVAQFPKDFEFCLLFLQNFLEICSTEDPCNYYDVLIKSFPNNPKIRTAVAERHISRVDPSTEEFFGKLSLVMVEYNELLAEFQDPIILDYCLKFLQKISSYSAAIKESVESRILEILEFAHEKEFLTEELYLKWADFPFADTHKVLNMALKVFPNSLAIWKKRCEIVLENVGDCVGLEEQNKIQSFIHKAASNVALNESKVIWLLYLDWQYAHLNSESFIASCHRAFSHDKSYLMDVIDRFLLALCDCEGADSVRTFYRKWMKDNLVSSDFYTACLLFEESQCDLSEDAIVLLNEKLCDSNPGNMQQWLQYLQGLFKLGMFEKASEIYWKAFKCISNKDEFIASYDKMKRQL